MIEPIQALAIVIPARDEAAVVGNAVAAARAAMNAADAVFRVRTLLVLVADACVDDTRGIALRVAAEESRMRVVSVDERSVGRARAIGVATALDELAHIPEQRVWLANTDADSEVPVDWCTVQLARANTGVDAVLGTVIPIDDGNGEVDLVEWSRTYDATEGHDHIHGANLGVRAAAHRAVGGFAPVSHDEDVELVRALRAHSGLHVVSTASIPVRTSSRIRGRAPHGFAEYLATRHALGANAQVVGLD